jgi:predicted transcriptional regulator
MNTPVTTLRLDADIKQRAESIAKALHISLSDVIRDALSNHVSNLEKEHTETLRAIQSWKNFEQTGLSSDFDDTMDWIQSWGTENELDAPECK